MPVNRIVLLMVVVGGLSLFIFSNLSLVLPMVFLGKTTVALPLAAWIGMAIAAGAVTSFFLQFLSYLQRGYSPQRVELDSEVPPRTRAYRRDTSQTPEPEFQRSYTAPPPSSPPPPKTPKNSAASDWEEANDEDWDFEEEPAASTSRDTPEADRTSYEVKQDTKTSSQTGSVYSYSYRQPTEPGVGKPDEVYDANFRVISSPYQKTTEPQAEDEEDWGFEDKEEDERKNKRWWR